MTKQPESDEATTTDAAYDRSSERLNFFLGTTLKTGPHEALPARVRNLSAGGMMVEFASEPDPELADGDAVVAELRNIGRVKGKVAWIEGKRIGVRFEKNIDPGAACKPVGGNAGKTGTGFVAPIVVPGRFLKY